MHGIGYIFDFLAKPVLKRIPRFIRIIGTFVFVTLASVAFRAPNVAEMSSMYQKILTGGFGVPTAELFLPFRWDEIWFPMRITSLGFMPYAEIFPFVLIATFTAWFILAEKKVKVRLEKEGEKLLGAILTAFIFLSCVLRFSNVVTFLYFNF